MTKAEEEDADKTTGLDLKAVDGGFRGHLGPSTRETELRLGLCIPRDKEVCDEKKGSGQAANQKNGGSGVVAGWKRGYSHAIGGAEEKRVISGFGNPWSLVQFCSVGVLTGGIKGSADGFGAGKGATGSAMDQEKIISEQKPKVEPTNAVLQRAPPVVGWPPVRTSRKNLTPQPRSDMEKEKGVESSEKPDKKVEDSLFVKVNMDGFPIGRKIDLKAYDSYVSLSRGLQQLFSRFLDVDIKMEVERDTAEHVLVYEDNEGDRMLVGDVPWEMFVSSVKRLWIMNGSEAPTIATTRSTKYGT
ncbi:auxin-responsive protein IAA25-like [Nymphaea colorata]|nr:auxin-responsive protein IAA25-like [Nymphaea colorata]